MSAEQLLRDEAIRFLKGQAPLAFLGLSVSAASIAYILNGEGIANVPGWFMGVLSLHAISLVIRNYNEELFITVSRRKKFGVIANFLEACVAGSCLLFISQASPGSGVFITSILMLNCTGSVMTSAGYKPFLRSFAGTLMFLIFLAVLQRFVSTEVDLYASSMVVVLTTIYLIKNLTQRTRDLILSQMSAQLAAQRAVKSKTRFFMSSGHDLRQPVAAASAYVSIALNATTDENMRQNLAIAKEAIKRIDDQITPVLELARIDSDQTRLDLKRVNLNKIISTLTKLYEPLANIDTKLKLTLPSRNSNTLTDPALLTRILTNILDNSIKYTEAGEISVTLKKSRSFFMITIKDTGIGIDQDYFELIFDEFYQIADYDRNKGKGSGLGLAIARRFCDKLGINLSLKSELGIYTEVKLEVPIK